MTDEAWPKRGNLESVDIEIHARFVHTRSWFNDNGQRYHNVSTALFREHGAEALFAEKSPVRKFLDKHGQCQLFAVAEAGSESIFTTLDGEILCQLDRSQIGNRKLEQVSIDELKKLSLQPETPRRRFTDL